MRYVPARDESVRASNEEGPDRVSVAKLGGSVAAIAMAIRRNMINLATLTVVSAAARTPLATEAGDGPGDRPGDKAGQRLQNDRRRRRRRHGALASSNRLQP